MTRKTRWDENRFNGIYGTEFRIKQLLLRQLSLKFLLKNENIFYTRHVNRQRKTRGKRRTIKSPGWKGARTRILKPRIFFLFFIKNRIGSSRRNTETRRLRAWEEKRFDDLADNSGLSRETHPGTFLLSTPWDSAAATRTFLPSSDKQTSTRRRYKQLANELSCTRTSRSEWRLAHVLDTYAPSLWSNTWSKMCKMQFL